MFVWAELPGSEFNESVWSHRMYEGGMENLLAKYGHFADSTNVKGWRGERRGSARGVEAKVPEGGVEREGGVSAGRRGGLRVREEKEGRAVRAREGREGR